MLELTQLKQEAHKWFVLHDIRDDFRQSGISGVLMQHDPTNGRVCITEASKQFIDVSKCLFLLQLSLNNVLVETLAASLKSLMAFVGQELNLLWHDVIHHSFVGCWEALPVR